MVSVMPLSLGCILKYMKRPVCLIKMIDKEINDGKAR